MLLHEQLYLQEVGKLFNLSQPLYLLAMSGVNEGGNNQNLILFIHGVSSFVIETNADRVKYSGQSSAN